jgi:hypothetical protein
VPPLPVTRVYASQGDYHADQICDDVKRAIVDNWYEAKLAKVSGSMVSISSFGGYLFTYQTRQKLREIRRSLAVIKTKTEADNR